MFHTDCAIIPATHEPDFDFSKLRVFVGDESFDNTRMDQFWVSPRAYPVANIRAPRQRAPTAAPFVIVTLDGPVESSSFEIAESIPPNLDNVTLRALSPDGSLSPPSAAGVFTLHNGTLSTTPTKLATAHQTTASAAAVVVRGWSVATFVAHGEAHVAGFACVDCRPTAAGGSTRLAATAEAIETAEASSSGAGSAAIAWFPVGAQQHIQRAVGAARSGSASDPDVAAATTVGATAADGAAQNTAADGADATDAVTPPRGDSAAPASPSGGSPRMPSVTTTEPCAVVCFLHVCV